MEHKLIQGGEQYLPFARSRIKALRALGLSHASQQFEIDGVSVKVRTDGEHNYINIQGESDPLIWVVVNATLVGSPVGGSYVDGSGHTHTTSTTLKTFRSYLFKLKMAKQATLKLVPTLVHTGSTVLTETIDGYNTRVVTDRTYASDAAAAGGISQIVAVGKSICGVCLRAAGTSSSVEQYGRPDGTGTIDDEVRLTGTLTSRLLLAPRSSGAGAVASAVADLTQTASLYGYIKTIFSPDSVFGGTLTGDAFSRFHGGVNNNAYFWKGDPHTASNYQGFAVPGAGPGGGWASGTPLTMSELRGSDGALLGLTDWAPSASLPLGFASAPVLSEGAYSPMDSAYSWIQGKKWFADSARTANAAFRIYNRDGSVLDTHDHYGQNGEIYAYLSKRATAKKFLSLSNVSSTVFRPIAANGALSMFDTGPDMDLMTWPGIRDDTAFKAMITAGTYYKQFVPALMTS